MANKKNYFLQLCGVDQACVVCRGTSVLAKCVWIPSKHQCNCEFCKHGEDDIRPEYYCAEHAIEQGFALSVTKVAELCGYETDKLRDACRRRAVKAFEHEGVWYVLASEVVDDDAKDELPI